MSICPTIDFDQSVEDRKARKTSPLQVFNTRAEIAVSLAETDFQMRIKEAEGRQAVQLVAPGMNAFAN